MENCDRQYSDVVIIGAGLSGVDMACQLQRQLNVTNYIIYDRAPEIGGAWAANKYPGCGVDIPGVLYSLSWFPNAEFTRAFPAQPEILAYIQRVALANKVTQCIKLRTEWKGAKWIESSNTWHVYLSNLDTGQDFVHEAKILVSAVGGYTNPKSPEIPGLKSFQGPVVHTAQWKKEYDVQGLNVAVIGNGCSGSQVVPAIIDKVNSVTQFIRSPQHYVSMPMNNSQFGGMIQTVFRFPFILKVLRWLTFWMLDCTLNQFWNDSRGKRTREKRLACNQRYISENAPEKYWPLLTPEYDLGCRRRILDNEYTQSLYSPKLKLLKESISLVKQNSIVSSSGREYSVDFIVLATGFEFTQWQAHSVVGRRGKTLQQHWDSMGGAGAYQTVAVNGFPNMFYLLGPNSGSGHTSVLFSMECSVNLVIDIARPILRRQAGSVEVCQQAEMKWCKTIQVALSKTVLTQSCSNVRVSNPIL